MNSKDAVCRTSCHESSGFTLLELMISVAVFSVLTAIAAPSFTGALQNTRRATVVNEFISALTFARSNAVNSRTSVTICRSTDFSNCADRGGWQSGWIVFTDLDADGVRDAEEPILRQHEAIGGNVSMNGNTNVSRKVTFRGFGGTANNGRLVYCDRRGWTDDARIIIVSTTGRVRSLTRSQDPNTPLSGCIP